MRKLGQLPRRGRQDGAAPLNHCNPVEERVGEPGGVQSGRKRPTRDDRLRDDGVASAHRHHAERRFDVLDLHDRIECDAS